MDAALLRDVRSGLAGSGRPLAAATPMSPAADRLAALRPGTLWIDEPGLDGADALPALALRARADVERRIAAVLARAGAALAARSGLDRAAVARLEEVVRRVAARLTALPEAAHAFADLATADAHTHGHMVSTTVLGLMLADRHWRRFGWTDAEGRRHRDGTRDRLADLGLGLLLHDVGKLAVPHETLHKPGALDRDERAAIALHVEAGVAMLERAGFPQAALDVVRCHHERLDGSGYPRGLAGAELTELARIAAIADTYDAVTSQRSYQGRRPPHVALNILAADAPAKYDPALVGTFMRVAVPFPVGAEVVLPDGGAAVVTAIGADPWRPVARSATGHRARIDLRHLDWRRAAAAGAREAIA